MAARTDSEGVTVRIDLEGPFFTRDPGKTLYANIREMMAALAAEMGDAVRSDIAAHQGGMPNWTGWTLEHTYGYTTSPVTGKHWAVSAAVATVTAGMSTKDAIRTKAAAASIEARWHPFRRVKSAVYRMRAVLTADLTEGMD